MASSRRSARSLRRRYFKIPAASSMIKRRSSGRALSTASSWPWDTMTCCWRPTPVSESSSWTSSRRHGAPLMAYSLSPERNRVRVRVTSENPMGKRPDWLSIVSDTSARPSAGRLLVPAKMTSSIFPDRTVRGPWAPRTQATASTMLDLPLPLGPTTTVTPGSKSKVVVSAKDLNPFRVSDFRNTSVNLAAPQAVDGGPCTSEPGSGDRGTSTGRPS